MNTIIQFLYRDASNYKKINNVIVSGELTEEQAREIIRSTEGYLFIPEQVDLPVERFGAITEDDHCWCEFMEDEFYALTDKPATVGYMTTDELVAKFKAAAGNWDDVKYALTVNPDKDDNNREINAVLNDEIIVCVRNGLVEQVLSENPSVICTVLDLDCLDPEDVDGALEGIEARVKSGKMYEIF